MLSGQLLSGQLLSGQLLSGQLLSGQLLSGISQSDGQPKLGNHRNIQRLENWNRLMK